MHGVDEHQHRRGQLTFLSTCKSADTVEFHHLTRVRKAVSRSKSGVQGKIADVFSHRSRHAESQNELKGFRILLAAGRPDHWLEQPFVLDYRDGGLKRHYTPDVLVVWGRHHEVIEIKEDLEADMPENQERFALIRELLSEHGHCFRVWSSSEISKEPRLTNAGLLLRYRCVIVPPVEREDIRQAFAIAPVLRLREFTKFKDSTLQSALRMVLSGSLHINWWEPLTLDSHISRSPIGPQIWPCPPNGVPRQERGTEV